MMKPRLYLVLVLVLGGCVTVKHQLTDPTVAARFDSQKPAGAFAHCAAAALPAFHLEQAGGAWALVRKHGMVQLSRWDFFATNHGSQAELRNGSGDSAGADLVMACV